MPRPHCNVNFMTNEQKNARSARKTSRRRIAKTVAAALAAAPLAATAQTTAPKEPKAPPNPQPTPTPSPSPQQPPPISPAAEAYGEVARVRFGSYLSAEESERVKRDLEGNVRAADRLRASKLKNSDEPDFVFGA